MGGYNDLKTAIAALIHTNDNQEITGATLQSALLSIINTIGQGSVFKGVATTSTNPGSPDADVFYIAGRPGYYPNFNLELTAGLHVIENKSGTWVNTEIVLDVVDAINIGGAKHVKPSQAMIINLQSIEQIPDSEGLNNKMWWSTDGNLKYKQNDTVYNLGAPAYVLYYCGDKIYKWTGSGFREIGGGGTFASGEAVSNMSIFDDGSDTEGKSSAQLAAMIPSGEVVKSLLQLISSIDTSGGSYDGVDLITTFSYDAPTRVITVKQSGRQAKTILLPLANSTNAGLMSSEDKTALANMQNLIGKTVNSFSKSTGETGITITLVTSNGTPHAVLIPIDSELSSQSTSNLVTGAAIYNFLMSGFVYLDQDSRAFAPYTRILPLVSMGSALDNGNTPAQINTNEFRYDPGTKRIYRHNNNQQPYFMPGASQLYLNICTGKMYKWAGSDMEEISSGVDPATLAGKADKHVAADILAPSQWPRVMLYNIESMWGAGGTPPDYASIPVGSIYLDDSDGVDDPPYRRLFYKKTIEGAFQRIDLGAPQENTIYCHTATGKLYRWIPTQNGNDGAFQQVGDVPKKVSDLENDEGYIKMSQMDSQPTAGNTTHMVSSDGVASALNSLLQNLRIVNGEWYIGNTATGVSAQGPAGNVNISDAGDLVTILVNDLTTGGAGNILTAEMGKVLKRNIMTLWAALGNYAFPGDKPTLDWGGGGTTTCSVTQTLGTHVVSDYQGGSVNLGDSLTVRLSSSDDLYVINPSSVKVKVGGVDMAFTYYNENTDIITIPTVVDNVVIEANAMTYVQDDLVLHLDCRHRGGTGSPVSGHWKSLVNYGQSPIDFTLKSGVTAADTGIVFDGSTNAYAETDASLNVLATAGTIEAVASGLSDSFNTILVNPIENAIGLSIHNVSNDSGHKNAVIMMGRSSSSYPLDDPGCTARVGDTTTDFAIAVTAGTPNGVGHNKGDALTVDTRFHLIVDPTYHNKLAIGCRLRSSSSNFLNGTIRAIRVYKSHLTADQQLQNWLVDKKRFNL